MRIERNAFIYKCSSGRQQGIVFYMVCTMVVMALILGGAFIFFLRSEVRMITHSQKSEVCLYLAEGAANEAFFRIRALMNQRDSDPYKALREKYSEETIPIKGLNLYLSGKLAGDLYADLAVGADFLNRQKFLKDLYSKDIPDEQQDDRETYGAVRVTVDVTYRGLKKRLTVYRDIKVLNPYPPKGDFSLWAKDAASHTLNPWLSQLGLQTKCLRVFNGTDDQQEYEDNADVFLGGGGQLAVGKVAGSNQAEHVGIPNNMTTSKRPIIINITGFYPLGNSLLDHYVKPGSIDWKGIYPFYDKVFAEWVNRSVPNLEFDIHTEQNGINVDSHDGYNKALPPAGRPSAYQMMGHDLIVEEDDPVKVKTFWGEREIEEYSGFKYYFFESFNEKLERDLAPAKPFLDITRSGLDLYGRDFAQLKKDLNNPIPIQFAHAIYGQVYKSMIRLRVTDITDPANVPKGGITIKGKFKTPTPPPEILQPLIQKIIVFQNQGFTPETLKKKLLKGEKFLIYEMPEEEQFADKAAEILEKFQDDNLEIGIQAPGTVWGLTPWRDHISYSSFAPDEKMDILNPPYYIEGKPNPWLMTLQVPALKDFAMPPWLKDSDTYRKYMTQVVQSPYDYKGTTRLQYKNRVRGYTVNVKKWADPGYHLEELGWNKISKSFGTIDHFMEESGLARFRRGEEPYPIMRLDGVWLISIFDTFMFDTNTIYSGKGTLIFLTADEDAGVNIDGMFSAKMFEKNLNEILSNKAFNINYRENSEEFSLENLDYRYEEDSKLTIVLLTIPGFKNRNKIQLSNRFVEASICAPSTTVELVTRYGKENKEYAGYDSQGEPHFDIDILGNLVLGELDLRTLDNKPGEEMQSAGGALRWDPFMVPPHDDNEYLIQAYRAYMSRKASYWSMITISGEED